MAITVAERQARESEELVSELLSSESGMKFLSLFTTGKIEIPRTELRLSTKRQLSLAQVEIVFRRTLEAALRNREHSKEGKLSFHLKELQLRASSKLLKRKLEERELLVVISGRAEIRDHTLRLVSQEGVVAGFKKEAAVTPVASGIGTKPILEIPSGSLHRGRERQGPRGWKRFSQG